MFLGRFGCGDVGRVGVGLLKPETFMNASGAAVAAALHALSDTEYDRDLIVVSDDLDLPFGRVRLRATGRAGGHRGIADITKAVGAKNFARLRFGIGRPPDGVPTVDYVLQKFSQREEGELPDTAAVAIQALETLLEPRQVDRRPWRRKAEMSHPRLQLSTSAAPPTTIQIQKASRRR